MSKLEIITSKNINRIKDIGPSLADTYRVAFAAEPWNEASRCPDIDCTVVYSGNLPGCSCKVCGSILEEAYQTNQLVSNWQDNLADAGLIEVSYLDDMDGEPQRATIVRPTTPEELFERKYKELPEMRDWISSRLPGEFIWIEDTFANRDRMPKGNLNERGATLKRVAEYYGGMKIATRTLSEAIVGSTLRDLKGKTAVYIGFSGVGSTLLSNTFSNPGYQLPTVPDRRTLLRVDLTEGTR